MTNIIAIIGTLIALAAASLTSRHGQQSIHCARLNSLSFLDLSMWQVRARSQIRNFYGLSLDVPIEEARNIAYLSMLLDSFQHFYYENDGDFTKMVKEMKSHSTFLNRILSVEENRRRWPILKDIYYGDFDSGFVTAVETLIAHEEHKK